MLWTSRLVRVLLIQMTTYYGPVHGQAKQTQSTPVSTTTTDSMIATSTAVRNLIAQALNASNYTNTNATTTTTADTADTTTATTATTQTTIETNHTTTTNTTTTSARPNGTDSTGQSTVKPTYLPPLQRVGCTFNAEAFSSGGLEEGLAKFNAEYCTELYYYRALLDGASSEMRPLVMDEVVPQEENGYDPIYQRFNTREDVNQDLVNTFLIVGERKNESAFSKVARDSVKTERFILSVIRTLRFWGFDGLAVDWKHTDPKNRKLFTTLMSRLMEAFVKEDSLTELKRILLVVFVGGPVSQIKKLYEVDKLHAVTDQLNVFHVDENDSDQRITTIWNPLFPPGPANDTCCKRNTPSYSNDRFVGIDGSTVATVATAEPGTKNHTSTVDKGFKDSLDSKLREWVWLGANASNINVVVSLTGHGYKLKDWYKHGIGDQAIGPHHIPQGDGTNGSQEIAYKDICSRVKSGGTLVRVSNSDPTPYWFEDEDWINFEDVVSLKHKVIYLQWARIKGVVLMFQSQDDEDGSICGHGPLPMSRVVYETSEVRRFIGHTFAVRQMYCIGPKYSLNGRPEMTCPPLMVIIPLLIHQLFIASGISLL